MTACHSERSEESGVGLNSHLNTPRKEGGGMSDHVREVRTASLIQTLKADR